VPGFNYTQLHGQCAKALKSYIHEARKTCDLLGGHEDGPADLAERRAIVEQRVRENDAYERYQKARLLLIDAAKLGEDSLLET
jgi:hypothetical protein